MGDRVRLEIQDGVADVRLARGDKLNALDAAMFSDLIDAGERLKAEPGVRAVVLSGEGRGFCAGLDMGSFQAMAAGQADAALGPLVTDDRTPGGANQPQHAVMVWREVPVPVIAAVHGVALGGGLQLALGCDLRFVAPDARLSILEIKWGLVPDMGGTALLKRLVRDDVARELVWTGRQVVGEEAVALGLATRVCADPHAEALAFARDIAGKSPNAIRAAKRLLNLSADADPLRILMEESREQEALLGSANQREVVLANLEKREPRFRD
jgi:enoyl-CoA hydratase/carnithine racemase